MTFKKLWTETPSSIAGIIVFVVLLFLTGFVCWSWFFSHSAGSLKYAAAAAIGGSIAYKMIKNKKLALDEERVVEGKLALGIGLVSGILFTISALFAVLKIIGIISKRLS